MSEYKLKTGKIGEKVVDTYQKIEDGVVGAYQKVEDGVVGAYKKIEGAFVDAFLEKVEEDKEAAGLEDKEPEVKGTQE